MVIPEIIVPDKTEEEENVLRNVVIMQRENRINLGLSLH